jgi:glycosyltransferase involved in cell wall biosynthesis
MVKIVTVVSRMNVGGVASLLIGYMENLDKNKFEHVLITGNCEDNETDLLKQTNFEGKVIYLQNLKRSVGVFKDLITFIEMRKILKSLSPDIVHTHTAKAGLIGRLSSLSLRNKPLIIHTYHGHLLYGYFSALISFLIVTIERVLAWGTNLLIADSMQVKIDLLNYGVGKEKNWQVVSPGIRKLPNIESDVARNELGISKAANLICWIGRFTNIKNPMLAAQSFSTLKNKTNKKFTMIMVGDGELFTSVQEYISNNKLDIKLVGWKTNVSNFLAASDILLLTSKNEGFGMVIAEAGWYGKPTISTKVGGVTEFISNGETGVLVDSNEDDISDAISLLFEDRSLMNKIGANAKKQTNNLFTSEIFTKKHEEIYLKILNS